MSSRHDTGPTSLTDAIRQAWSRGWSPADLDHIVRREFADTVAVSLAAAMARVADGLAVDVAPPGPGWLAELEDLRREGSPGATPPSLVPVALFVRTLPSIHAVLGVPGSGVVDADLHGLDAKLATRVRSLLAKAESTSYPEEAEAFTAKAQELIARHALDEAAVRRVDEVGEPSSRRVRLDDPYLTSKGYVVGRVAAANRCEAVEHRTFGLVTVFGYPADLAATEVLSLSLLAQATAAMTAHGTVRDERGKVRTRSFRRSFLLGFGTRLGERLQQVADEQVAASSSALVPVLKEMDHRVTAAMQTAYPRVRSRRLTVTGSGWGAGAAAADRADLDPRHPLRRGAP